MSPRTATAALMLVALAACTPSTPRSVVPTESAPPTTTAPSVSPSATRSPSATPSLVPPGQTMRVAVYYLGPTARPALYREFRTVPQSAGVVRSAVDAMLHTPPLDTDYRSLWPRATTVRGISVSGSTATVDLSANARSVTASAAAERASLQQLVHTVTAAAPNVTGVRLRFDGATRATLWGHVDTTGRLTRGSAAGTLGAVWVVTPALGARVGRTFTVTGTATVFEATVSWSVTRGGSTLASGSVNASIGAPGRGDWTVRVTLPAGTAGDVVFTGWEASAEDGRVTSPDTKTFRVG